MTTREKLIRDVLDLPEAEIEAVAEFIASRRANGSEPDAAPPGDEWGDLDAWTDAASADAMRMLDEEEAAAGFSWEDHRPS